MKLSDILKKYLLTRKFFLIVYVMIGISTTIIYIYSSYIIGNFIDVLVKSREMREIYFYISKFTILNIISFFLDYFANRLYLDIQMNSSFLFNKDLIEHFQCLSLIHSDNFDKSYITQEFNNDSNGLVIFLMDILKNIPINIITLIVSFAFIINLSFTITMILVSSCFFYIVVFIIMKRKIYEINLKLLESQSEFFKQSFIQISRLKSIKIHNISNYLREFLDKSFSNLKEVSKEHLNINYIYSGLNGMTQHIVLIITFLYGGYLVINEKISIGELTIIAAFFNNILTSINYFMSLGEKYQEARGMLQRTNELLKIPKETNGKIILEKIEKVTTKNLNFSYGDKVVLKNFSYEFTKGNIYLIEGNNGVGKTTLTNLLAGLYIDNFQGEIRINNCPIKKIDMKNLRETLISYTEQSPFLIYSYIKEIPRKKFLRKILKEFNLENIDIDNNVTKNLSQGQKQKFAIVQTLYKNGDLLFFDEPTSNLDNESKKAFFKILKEIKKDKIIILISHEDIKSKVDYSVKL